MTFKRLAAWVGKCLARWRAGHPITTSFGGAPLEGTRLARVEHLRHGLESMGSVLSSPRPADVLSRLSRSADPPGGGSSGPSSPAPPIGVPKPEVPGPRPRR